MFKFMNFLMLQYLLIIELLTANEIKVYLDNLIFLYAMIKKGIMGYYG